MTKINFMLKTCPYRIYLRIKRSQMRKHEILVPTANFRRRPCISTGVYRRMPNFTHNIRPTVCKRYKILRFTRRLLHPKRSITPVTPPNIATVWQNDVTVTACIQSKNRSSAAKEEIKVNISDGQTQCCFPCDVESHVDTTTRQPLMRSHSRVTKLWAGPVSDSSRDCTEKLRYVWISLNSWPVNVIITYPTSAALVYCGTE